MFRHFYGVEFKKPESEITQPTGNLFRVDLAEFYPACNPELYSMNASAWMYVPRACDLDLNWSTNETEQQNGTAWDASNSDAVKCRLHLAFHGYQLPWRISLVPGIHNAFVEDAGYLQAADSNNIILLFPESLWRGYDIIGFTGPEKFGKYRH